MPPDGTDTASGRGCPADSGVSLSLTGPSPGGASVTAGSTLAKADGTFDTVVAMGSEPIGRYLVKAACGLVLLTAPLDVVLASQVSADTSTEAIILFFLLLGVLTFRRRLAPVRRSVKGLP